MLNDDLISAYLDGELDAERRAMVEHQLRVDKGAAARFERLRAADDALVRAFPAVDQSKDNLLAAIILATQPLVTHRGWGLRAGALAAAVVIGLALGQFFRNEGGAPYSISAQEARLLDTQLSGRSMETAGGAFEIVLSLRSEAGELCRQFRLTREARSTDVLACRSGEEQWRMVAAATAARSADYVPAGRNSPLDAAIEALGPADALDALQEAAYISRSWRQLP